MREFFNPESSAMIFITRAISTIWLNILWFVCSLPIITAGASTTALFSVTLNMARGKDSGITKHFFQAFRSNFRLSTKVWGIMLLVEVVLIVDSYMLWLMQLKNPFWIILTGIYLIFCIICLIAAMYIFPLMTQYENTVKAFFYNSFMMGIHNPLCTILMAAIYFLMVLAVVRFYTPLILFGEGFCAYLCSFLLTGVLDKCTPSK